MGGMPNQDWLEEGLRDIGWLTRASRFVVTLRTNYQWQILVKDFERSLALRLGSFPHE